ncbi:MAG: DMT family transporter, partial [Methanocella sp.]
ALTRISRRDAGLFALAGLFGIVLYFIFENTGLAYTTASNASLLVAALPVFTMASEALFFRLRITRTMLLCVAASVAGVYLLVTVDGRLDFGSSRLVGNVLVLLAIACWVVYTIVNRSLAEHHSSLTAIAYQTLASAILFLPLVGREVAQVSTLAAVPAAAWAHLVFLGVFCSAVAYFCYVYGVRRLGPTLAASFLNLVPVVTVAGGFLFLGERLSWSQLGGMVLVMGAVYRLSRVTVPTSQSQRAPSPSP